MKTKLRVIPSAGGMAIFVGLMLALGAYAPRGQAEPRGQIKASAQKPAGGKNNYRAKTDEERAIQKAIDSILALPLPEKTLPLAICPFTNSRGDLTTLSLCVYLPVLYRSMWDEKRLRNGPDEVMAFQQMGRENLMNAGREFSMREAARFSRSLGCENFVIAQVENSGGQVSAKIFSTLDTNLSTAPKTENGILLEEIHLPEKDIAMLPGRIAAAILGEYALSKPTAEIMERVKRPVVRDLWSLIHALRLTRFMYLPGSNEGSLEMMRDLLLREPDLDFLWPMYFSYLYITDNDLGVQEAQKYVQSHNKDHRIQALYTSLLQHKERDREALEIALPLLREDPGNTRLTWVAARAAKSGLGLRKSYPLYQRLLELAPVNPSLLYVLGEMEKDLAWDYRGGDWADKVPDKDFEQFFKYLEKASAHLKKSSSWDPDSSDQYSLLITVGMGLNWPYETVHDYFLKAVKINPNNSKAYYRFQTYLLPRWHGSYQAVRAFWKEAEAIAPKNTDIPDYMLDYHFREANVYAQDKETRQYDMERMRQYYSDPDVWSDIQAAFNKLFSLGVDGKKTRGAYGFYAAMARHYDFAFEQFERSHLKFGATDTHRYEDYLSLYLESARETKHYERIVQIADEGLKMNHCPICNAMLRTAKAEALKILGKKQ